MESVNIYDTKLNIKRGMYKYMATQSKQLFWHERDT